MTSTSLKSLMCLILIVPLVGCSREMTVMAPDTRVGDQLQPAYMVGRWCTNRDLTAQTNEAAGNSALVNMSQQYWSFRESGKWEDSPSGWMYAYYGKWQLEGADTLILDRLQGEPVSYRASFTGAGTNLRLQDEKGQFLVLSRCE